MSTATPPGVNADLRRAFVNMAAKAGSIVIERVAQLVLLLGAAPILGVVSFGRFSFANSVTALLAFGTDLGLTLWTTRALAREPAHSAGVLGTAYHLRLWATVPYFIALAAVSASLGPGEARIAMLAIGVVSLARALLDHARAVFRARERIGDEGKVNALGASLATIGALAAVALTRRGLPALALGMMAGTLVSAVYGFALLGRYGPWTGPFDRALARRMLREALPFWLAGIFSLAYSRGDVVVLRALTGDAEVGTYRAAGQLYDVAKTLPVVVMTAMFPQLARHFRFARERLRRAEWGVSAALTAAGIVTAAVLAVAAGFVAHRIFGAGFARTVPTLRILSAALPLVFLNCGLTHFLVARDLGVLNMIFAGLVVPVNVVANVQLSRRLGAPGAAWSMLITEAALSLCCLVALYVARRSDGSELTARRGP
jgi:O-antigen/teichoic acid export membrane protein